MNGYMDINVLCQILINIKVEQIDGVGFDPLGWFSFCGIQCSG